LHAFPACLVLTLYACGNICDQEPMSTCTARHCKRHPSSMDVCMFVSSVDIINHTKTPYMGSVCLLEKSAVLLQSVLSVNSCSDTRHIMV